MFLTHILRGPVSTTPLLSHSHTTTPTTKPHFLHVTTPKPTTTIPSVSVSNISSSESWAPHSWMSKKALQLPDYPDPEELRLVLNTLESFPPIVFAGEARNLEERLAQAALGEAFLLQGGDCAESFKEFSADNIRDTFRVLLQMGIVLTYGAQIPVIKVRSGSLSLCLSFLFWVFFVRWFGWLFRCYLHALRVWEFECVFVVFRGLGMRFVRSFEC